VAASDYLLQAADVPPGAQGPGRGEGWSGLRLDALMRH
jgi:hypothetical protein